MSFRFSWVPLILALGGCFLDHGATERYGGATERDGGATERDGGPPPIDAHVEPDVCAFEPGAAIFDVEVLADELASEPYDVDAAGRVYLGILGDSYRWDGPGVLVSLDALTGSPAGRIARIAGVAPDGSFAGQMWQDERTHAFVWSEASGLVDLSEDDDEDSSATAIAPNGTIVVNEARRASLRLASRLTQLLGLPPDANTRHAVVQALDIVQNGTSTVVGTSTADETLGVWRAFVWTGAGELRLLPNDGALRSRALAISDDGAFIVGTASSLTSDAMTPVVWRGELIARIPLLPVPELAWGAATDVNDHGVIVGGDTGPSVTGPNAYGWMMVGDRKLAIDALLADGAAWHVTRAVRVTEDLRVLAVAQREGSEVREAVMLRPRCALAE
ncbi:hypothetical protein [Sandaracinus amylolyticus]|uniref:hypothetical protein n=1 Tax=Sandaracinus amylolyticus TaxID=927083 RepID=UPI001F23B27D|nr:hypothetical protein [Sandaracinus amylolyticus]UJR86168.1 Hypothetical protein I5071_82500 [Sandaracinus amylolyticus]